MAFLRWLWLNSPNVARTAGGRSLQISSKSIGSTIGSVFHFLITWLLLTKPYRHPLIWSRLLSQPRWDYQKCHFKHFRFERLFRGLRIFGPMYFWLLSSTNSSSREQHCTVSVYSMVSLCLLQVESGAFTHFGCGDAACFPVHNWRILYTQMKTQCIRYIATDFHEDRFSSIFENRLQSWSTDFGCLPPSSPISETAEASGVILQLRHTCVSPSAMTQ